MTLVLVRTVLIAIAASATQTHEIGHELEIGREDDEVRASAVFNNFEVYTGSVEDDTPEFVRGSKRWSIMARTTFELADSPMDGKYFAFSLEELSTVQKP